VSFFRGASPYIEGHRGRTFVVLIPGEVVGDRPLLYPLLEDVALLHGASSRYNAWLGCASDKRRAKLTFAVCAAVAAELLSLPPFQNYKHLSRSTNLVKPTGR